MDRRQLLLGMTAMGLAGSLNLNELVSAQAIGTSSQTPKANRIHPPDLELNEPRGPIKKCIEETSTPDGGVMTYVREYSPDGKMVSWHTERDGRLINSSAERVHTEVRDDQDRMVKFVSGERGQPPRESFYTYDSAGRMLTATNSENSDRTEFRYENGVTTSIYTFDPRTIERTRHAGLAGSAWDGAYVGFGVPTGGTVIMTSGENDIGTEMRILAPDGQVVSQIVRKYDAEGRLVEEKPLQRNVALLMLDSMSAEEGAKYTPEQLQVRNKALRTLANGKAPPITTYTNDDEGHLTRTFERNMFFQQTTTILYNEQGDKAEERKVFKDNSIIPHGVPCSLDEDGNFIPTAVPERPEQSFPFKDSVVRNTYQYDSFGNWTEKIETRDDGSSTTTRRTLTYY